MGWPILSEHKDKVQSFLAHTSSSPTINLNGKPLKTTGDVQMCRLRPRTAEQESFSMMESSDTGMEG